MSVINVALTIIETGVNGNTNDGKYFFSFDQNVIVVLEPDTVIEFCLSPQTSKEYQIADLAHSETRKQIRDVEVFNSRRCIKLMDENTESDVIDVVVLVEHTNSEGKVDFVKCDPQVVNRPRT